MTASQNSNTGSSVPTMVNQVEPPTRVIKPLAEELADDIVAIPLSGPDFANDIQSYLVNRNLSARWIFTDRRRYAQAKSQGWRNCTRQDLKPDFATLNPFEEEGGTKYINGDLILMVIEKRRYLGALRKKHDTAFALADPQVQKELSRRRAENELHSAIAAGKMAVFTPGARDLSQVQDQQEIEAKISQNVTALGRMGHEGSPDFGTRDDLQKGGK